MTPELVAEFVRELHAEVNRQQRNLKVAADLRRRELGEVQRKLIEAISDGFRAPGLQAKLDELEKRKAVLANTAEEPRNAGLRLHPNLAGLYRKKVDGLEAALADPTTQTEALEILRSLIERISVRHAGDGLEVVLVGEIANRVRLSAGAEPLVKAI